MKRLILFIFLLPLYAIAQVPDPQPNTYVNDLAGKLTADEIRTLNDSLLSLEKRTSVQLAIVLVDNLPAGMSIDEYTLEIGRRWHVGNARNGLVYAAAFNDKKQRLEVAGNLQYKITDIDALHIIDKLKPAFKSKQYYSGLQGLIADISTQINATVATEQMQLAKTELDKKEENSSGAWFTILSILGLAVIGFIIGFKYRMRKLKQKEDAARQKEKDDKFQRDQLIRTDTVYHNSIDELEQLRQTNRPTFRDTHYNNQLAHLNRIKSNPDPIKKKREEDDSPAYIPPSIIPDSSSSSSSYNSSSNDSSSYGSWGSGSSDSGSSSSGFDGGGASSDL